MKKKPAANGPAEPQQVSPPKDPAAQVLKWVLKGATRQDIKEAIAATFPDADADSLILEVFRGLEESAGESAAVLTGWCLETTRELYRRMVEIGDFPGALRAVRQLEELARRRPRPPEEKEDDAITRLLLEPATTKPKKAKT